MNLLHLLDYSIDTSAILDSWVRWHPHDLFPSLWINIEKMINDGTLRAIDEVREELSKKDDDVYKWAKDRNNLFIPLTTDIQIQHEASNILAKFPKLVGAMGDRSQADVFVIALSFEEEAGTTVIDLSGQDKTISIIQYPASSIQYLMQTSPAISLLPVQAQDLPKMPLDSPIP